MFKYVKSLNKIRFVLFASKSESIKNNINLLEKENFSSREIN